MKVKAAKKREKKKSEWKWTKLDRITELQLGMNHRGANQGEDAIMDANNNAGNNARKGPKGGRNKGGGGGGGGATARMKGPDSRSQDGGGGGGGGGAAPGCKQDALLTSPSDSGDQARLQARPAPNSAAAAAAVAAAVGMQDVGQQQPPSYFSVVSPAVPHFVASNEMRGAPGGPGGAPAMYPMPPPPPQGPAVAGAPPAQFEHVSMGPGAANAAAGAPPFCDLQDQLSQPYFDPQVAEDESAGIKAVVEKQGYISLHLRYDAHVDIAPNQAIRIVNHRKGITLALSGCATQMALVHPQGRVLQYNSRIEIQTEDFLSIKNAKMWPRGVSFTANNCALVYLVDQAGARSTTDTFHDLYADNIADSKFSWNLVKK